MNFNTPFNLHAGHYFPNPEVGLDNGNFLWLSAPHPQFTGDLQTWISNANLAPDWLRIGTAVIGGSNPRISTQASRSKAARARFRSQP